MNDPMATTLAMIQAREGLSINRMARLIGIDPSHLCLILSGKRRAGRKVLDGAGRIWPEVLTAHAASLKICHTDVASTPETKVSP